MKKLLPAFISLFLLASCSGDDPEPADADPVIPSAATFKKIIQTDYAQSGEPYLSVYDYTDGKLARMTRSMHGSVYFYTDYAYNTNGLMISAKTISSSSYPDTEELYTYDNQGRLENITFKEDDVVKGEMVYNRQGNVFTGITTYTNGATDTKTYIMNNDGIIYRAEGEGFDDDWRDSVFEGYNIISATENDGASSAYTYDNVHNMGILGLQDGNGDFRSNIILRLRNQYLGELEMATKYLLEEIYEAQDETIVKTHTYTFTEDGFPLMHTMLWNGEQFREYEYVYE